MLIDATLYRDYGGMDESFQWWWTVKKLQAKALVDGRSVKGYRSHDVELFHSGGKAGMPSRTPRACRCPARRS